MLSIGRMPCAERQIAPDDASCAATGAITAKVGEAASPSQPAVTGGGCAAVLPAAEDVVIFSSVVALRAREDPKPGRECAGSDKSGGIAMDSLITAAARALAAGDPLSALKRVALRDDPPALVLRGIAMAQLGDLPRARDLLRRAARGFGAHEATARARCMVAEAEIGLVSRDLSGPTGRLAAARAALEAAGDRANAAHAGYLEARRLLLIGRLDEAEGALSECDIQALPPASRTGYWLVAASIAMRRIPGPRRRASRSTGPRTRRAPPAFPLSRPRRPGLSRPSRRRPRG
jgi:hypothetical protein